MRKKMHHKKVAYNIAVKKLASDNLKNEIYLCQTEHHLP